MPLQRFPTHNRRLNWIEGVNIQVHWAHFCELVSYEQWCHQRLHDTPFLVHSSQQTLHKRRTLARVLWVIHCSINCCQPPLQRFFLRLCHVFKTQSDIFSKTFDIISVYGAIIRGEEILAHCWSTISPWLVYLFFSDVFNIQTRCPHCVPLQNWVQHLKM